MRMVLSDYPAEFFQFRAAVVIRTDFPDNFARFLVNDEDNVAFTPVHDDVFRIEPFVTVIIPFIGSKL